VNSIELDQEPKHKMCPPRGVRLDLKSDLQIRSVQPAYAIFFLLFLFFRNTKRFVQGFI